MATCKVCAHPARIEIEERLRDETNIPQMAGEYGLSRTALKSHQGCMRRALKEAAARHNLNLGESLLEHAQTLHLLVQGVIRKAKKERNPELLLRSIDSARRNMEFVARLTGKYTDHEREKAKETGSLTLQQYEQLLAEKEAANKNK